MDLASTLSCIATSFSYRKISCFDTILTLGLSGACILAKDASFRLIVSGVIGVKEIERLIKKLQLDKEILADQDDEDDEAAH